MSRGVWNVESADGIALLDGCRRCVHVSSFDVFPFLSGRVGLCSARGWKFAIDAAGAAAAADAAGRESRVESSRVKQMSAQLQ